MYTQSVGGDINQQQQEQQQNQNNVASINHTGAPEAVQIQSVDNNIVGDLAHVEQLIYDHAASAAGNDTNTQKVSPSYGVPNQQVQVQLHQPGTSAQPPTKRQRTNVVASRVPHQNAYLVQANQSQPIVNSHANLKQNMNSAITNAAPTHLSNNQKMGEQFVTTASGRQKKVKSQAQIDRRRERNRILARRTRLRKKFFFESLQKEVINLHRENQVLKDMLRDGIEDKELADKVLKECCTVELPDVVKENCAQELGIADTDGLDPQDFSLVKSLKTSQQCFVITDPSLQDNPIVYASDDFYTLTGYTRNDVLGRNCRFLQGPDTNQAAVQELQKRIASGDDVSICLLNYKCDGTPFWNHLFVAALRDTCNNIVNFIGVLVPVAGPDSETVVNKVGTSEPAKSEVKVACPLMEETVSANVKHESVSGSTVNECTGQVIGDTNVDEILAGLDDAVAAAPDLTQSH